MRPTTRDRPTRRLGRVAEVWSALGARWAVWIRLARGRRRGEEGMATAMAVFLAVMMLAGAGLAVDSGYALGERREAMNIAEQAARIGADALSEGGLRDGQVVVNPGAGRAAAHGYLASRGAHGSVSIAADQVTVTVTGTYDTKLISVVGVGSIAITATASSRSITEDTP